MLHSTTAPVLNGNLLASGRETRLRWTAGAGAEWAFSDRWSAKLEYDFYDFGSHIVNVASLTSSAVEGGAVQQRIHAVKRGLNYRFWSP